MNHNKIKEHIYSLYDGELPFSKQEEARKHLESCAECQEEIDHWKKTSDVMFPKTSAPLNHFFTQKVMRAIENEDSPAMGRSFWNWLAPSFGFGMAALLLFLSFLPTAGSVSADDILNSSNAVSESTSMENLITYLGGDEQ